jgi:ribosomal protein S20
MSAVKSFKKAVSLGDNPSSRAELTTGQEKDAVQEAFRQVQKALDKAVKASTLNKNTAARKKSRLSKLIKKLS